MDHWDPIKGKTKSAVYHKGSPNFLNSARKSIRCKGVSCSEMIVSTSLYLIAGNEDTEELTRSGFRNSDLPILKKERNKVME